MLVDWGELLRASQAREPKRTLRPPTHDKISPDQITDIALLKSRYKQMRKIMRKIRPKDSYLAYDSLDWLAFEWGIDSNLRQISDAINDGTYRAAAPEVIRGAKSTGLTRPLAFPRLIDAIVYRNIVALIENDLVSEMQDWTRAGRISEVDTDSGSDSGWFRQWLRRASRLWVMTEEYNWLVETDVSNFFPNVAVPDALEHLLSHSRLSVESARLLKHLLERFSPTHNYRESAAVGLPQDSFDASRIIAHSYLGEVDHEFEKEGLAGGYSRFMDDITIGASSQSDGRSLVGRAQAALERIGLYPNASKTRVIRRDKYEEDYLKDENDYIGEVERLAKVKDNVDRDEFEARLRRHVNLRSRPKGWERVLRRYYTASRILRSEILRKPAFNHIRRYPGSARSVLDYLATFTVEAADISRLSRNWNSLSPQYQDVRILCMEYLALVPNSGEEFTEEAIVKIAKKVYNENKDDHPRLAAAAITALGKFGSEVHLAAISSIARDRQIAPVVRSQAITISLGARRLEPTELPTLAVEGHDVTDIEFLLALHRGDHKAFQMTLDRADLRQRRSPTIWMIPPRPMFLVPTLRAIDSETLEKRKDKWRKLLNYNEEGIYDSRGDQWLGLFD